MSRKTKMMAVAGVIVLGACMAFMSMGAGAADVSVTATVSSVLSLSVGSPVAFGTVVPGTTATGSTLATVSSNKIWSLKVTKGGDLVTGAGGTGLTIPSANLTYGSTTSNSKVKNVQAAGTQFGTDTNICNTCDRGSGMAVTVSYSLLVPDDVEPGAYTATHTYTATQP